MRNDADKELHKCKCCGHDGGSEEVAKQDTIVGIGGWACIDQHSCAHRIRVRNFGTETAAGIAYTTRLGPIEPN